jgi:hypothetical protein
VTFQKRIPNRKITVCPFPNIRSNIHEITRSSQLTIIWIRNTYKGRIENGIKCGTHIDKSRKENKIRCSRHNNRSRIGNVIRRGKHIDICRTKKKIKCRRNNINHRKMHKIINWRTWTKRNIILIKVLKNVRIKKMTK